MNTLVQQTPSVLTPFACHCKWGFDFTEHLYPLNTTCLDRTYRHFSVWTRRGGFSFVKFYRKNDFFCEISQENVVAFQTHNMGFQLFFKTILKNFEITPQNQCKNQNISHIDPKKLVPQPSKSVTVRCNHIIAASEHQLVVPSHGEVAVAVQAVFVGRCHRANTIKYKGMNANSRNILMLLCNRALLKKIGPTGGRVLIYFWCEVPKKFLDPNIAIDSPKSAPS